MVIIKKMKNDRIGETSVNRHGSVMKIIDYYDASNINVLFPEYNYIKYNETYGDFTKQYIKCPYDKTVYGVGYLGEGDAECTVKADDRRISHPIYSLWTNMIKRCYDAKSLKTNPTYENCFVCDEWHNYNNFYEWYNDNYYEVDNEKMQLDKDILVKGNRVYSPETCIFVPQTINLAFIKKTGEHKGLYPTGVGLNRNKDKYVAYITIHKNIIHLGTFERMEDAENTYILAKEQYVKDIAEDYKNKIPKKLYKAINNYSFKN